MPLTHSPGAGIFDRIGTVDATDGKMTSQKEIGNRILEKFCLSDSWYICHELLKDSGMRKRFVNEWAKKRSLKQIRNGHQWHVSFFSVGIIFLQIVFQHRLLLFQLLISWVVV